MSGHTSGARTVAEHQKRQERRDHPHPRCCVCDDQNRHVYMKTVLGEDVYVCPHHSGHSVVEFITARQALETEVLNKKEYSSPKGVWDKIENLIIGSWPDHYKEIITHPYQASSVNTDFRARADFKLIDPQPGFCIPVIDTPRRDFDKIYMNFLKMHSNTGFDICISDGDSEGRWKNHPELLPGEQFYSNSDADADYAAENPDIKSLRRGDVAYDCYDRILPHKIPWFCQREEFLNRNRKKGL